MEWLYYLLEANLYLLLFYGFYRLFLQNETFYNSNRYYLLLSSVTAFLLPIMQLGFLNPAPIVDNTLFPPPILYTEEQLAKMTFVPVQETFNLTDWLYPIYLIIALGFAIKLSISLFKIIRLWLNAKKAKTGKITLIELKEQTTAFSFFNLLFIHPHLAEKQTVLNHEMVHIKQKHSFDILFFELLQIICWFNPIIYFIKNDIKLLHEYIADELSTNTGIEKHEYAMFLIENSFGIVPTPLTNQIFNQSILKRRINMLNKKRTANWARLRLLLALPLVGVMLCASTMAFTKNYGYVDLLPEKSKTAETVQQEALRVENIKKQTKPRVENIKKDQIKFPPPIVKPQSQEYFYTEFRNDKKTGNPISNEKRYIVINGEPVSDINKFYGASNLKSVRFLKPSDAIKKYGDKGSYGAVEITAPNIKYVKKLSPPPPRKMDQIKFPPPIIKPVKNLTNKEQSQSVSAANFTGKSVFPQKNSNEAKTVINFSGVQSYTADKSKSVFPTQNNAAGTSSLYTDEKANDYTSKALKISSVLDRTNGKKFLITSSDSEMKSITIYDRLGNVIYSDNNYNNDWDGNYGNTEETKSKIVAKGTYYYFASSRGSDGKGNMVKGYFTII